MSNKQLAFSIKEFQGRLERVQGGMKERGITLLLVHTPENVYYLSGHQSPGYYMYMCLMVPLEGKPTLVLRRGELGNAWTYSWLDNLVLYDDTDDPVLKTVQVLRDQGLGVEKIGIEYSSWFLTIDNYIKLKELLPQVALIDASGLIEESRMVKSAAEIEYIKGACRAASKAIEMAVDSIRVGTNEDEVAAAMFRGLCLCGSEYLGMEPFVASGPRSGSMHSAWSGRVIREGDSVLLEVAGAKNRYHGALMRTVYVGNPPSRVKEWSEICIEALNAAIAAIKPGVTSGYVDEACRSVIEKAGLFEKFRKRTGYSIGIAFAPDWGEGKIMSLQKDDKRILKAGMVFHMPPALREYGEFGVGFSETVLVTDNGCEVLTNYPRQLIIK